MQGVPEYGVSSTCKSFYLFDEHDMYSFKIDKTMEN